MIDALHHYLEQDHMRLDGLLQQATAAPGEVDPAPYAEFRAGLLRHIAIEEKLLFPAIAEFCSADQSAAIAQLHLEHGAIVALLVPPPAAGIIRSLRAILDRHNEIEEKTGGVYALAGRLAPGPAETLFEAVRAMPEVPVLPHNPSTGIVDATRRAVERAGYVLYES